MIEDMIEHETVATNIVTSSKPLDSSRADCQIHTYFSHEEKKPVHLLNLDSFPKESPEIEVESIVVTSSISSFSESLELFAIVH